MYVLAPAGWYTPPRAGTPYFSKVGEVVDIEGWLKLFLMYATALGRLR